MSLERFMVALDDPSHKFSPGEIVTGNIYVDVRKRKVVRASERCDITGIKVGIRGNGEVHWTESSRTGSVEFEGEEPYFETELAVLGESAGEKMVINGGCYTFPFKFRLPRYIPSSIETTHGSVRYSVNAILERSSEIALERTAPFIVETPLDLSQSTAAMAEINDEEYDKFSRFYFFSQGAMRIKVFVPSSGFAIGETIRATITVDSTSTRVHPEKIELRLEQNLKFRSRFPHSRTKSRTNVVQHVEAEGPFDRTDEIVVSMRVPSLPYSYMIHCRLIDVVYKLKVIVAVSDGHEDIEKEYPITIGTRAALPAGESSTNSDVKSDRESSRNPDVTLARESSTNPDVTLARESSTNPDETLARESSTNPDETLARESSTNPDETPAHESSTNPDVTTAPVPSAPFAPDDDESPAPTDAMPMPMPVPIPMPMPVPIPMPVPYLPVHGEKIAQKTSNGLNPLAASFWPKTSNGSFVTVNTPYPTVNTPYPMGNTPYPTGNTPYPTGNTPYPTGNTPYPTGNTPYPPATPGPIGFVVPSPAEPSCSTDPTAPPSYSEAMAMSKKY